jgi:transposase
LLAEDPSISPALKSSIELLLLLVTLLLNRLGINSTNSSKPPSADPNRKKKKKAPSEKKPGGQNGHNGTTLQKFTDPDVIEKIPVDKTTLPEGAYKDVGYESRQIVDIDISRIVTEYRAQILEDANGKKYTAPFPEGVCHPVQYIWLLSIETRCRYFLPYPWLSFNMQKAWNESNRSLTHSIQR